MHKIITSDFEIDLSGYNISIQEENSWFSDTFFTKYSYPFDLIITDEINSALGDILSHDSKSGKRYIECQYVFYNKIENAVLLIERQVGDVASVSLKYGMDEFPNFDKNLSELNLYKADVPDIYFHASVIVTSTYPVVNHNFPQIHTDKYDPSEAEFNGFEKKINNRKDGFFLTNTVDIVDGEDVMFNRNIMQPMPYLMYVLKKGFELSGLELKGDIVDDQLLNKILIYAETDPFTKIEVDPISITLYYDELNLDGWTPYTVYIIPRSIIIDRPGKYNMIGSFNLSSGTGRSSLIVTKDNEVLYSKEFGMASAVETFADFDFILPSGICEIKVVAKTKILSEKPVIFDFQILPVYYINANGKKETNLLNANHVDLNKMVPNVTFGTFVNTVLNMFNYDVDAILSTEIVINRITKSMQENEIMDLSRYENVEVERSPESDISYLLKYEDEGDVDLGGFYIDKKETKFVTKEFNKPIQNTIDIAVYPLQNELIDDVFTAKSVQSSDDKICFVMYDGLVDNNNYTIEPTALAIPNLVENYYHEWLRNRVNAMPYTMSFITPIEDIIFLNTKKRIFAYNNIHLIKNIEKNQLQNGLFAVELETETLDQI